MADKEQPIVLAHVVWMDRYAGDTHTIWRAGWDWDAAGHDRDNTGEQHLFRDFSGECLGYVPRFFRRERRHGFKALDLRNFGATARDAEFGPITVVWTATPPYGADRVIVGWYRNATAFKQPIELDVDSPGRFYYFRAPYASATILPPARRTFEIQHSRRSTNGGPGHDSIYYVSRNAPSLARKVRRFIDTWDADGRSRRPKDGGGAPLARQNNIPRRIEVELNGMQAVEAALASVRWTTEPVHTEKCGWDLTAKRGESTWLVEIKGLSSSTISIELTPNEYACARQTREDGTEYIIAIATDALNDAARRVYFFRSSGGEWRQVDPSTMRSMPDGLRLRFEERVAARFRATY